MCSALISYAVGAQSKARLFCFLENTLWCLGVRGVGCINRTVKIMHYYVQTLFFFNFLLIEGSSVLHLMHNPAVTSQTDHLAWCVKVSQRSETSTPPTLKLPVWWTTHLKHLKHLLPTATISHHQYATGISAQQLWQLAKNYTVAPPKLRPARLVCGGREHRLVETL